MNKFHESSRVPVGGIAISGAYSLVDATSTEIGLERSTVGSVFESLGEKRFEGFHG
jgi:hypothetical protein